MWSKAVICLVAAAVPMAGCQFTTGPSDTSDIVIGASLELNGAYAAVGTAYQDALQLRVDEINTQGGVDGRHLKLEVVDNKSDGTTALASVVDLASRPDVAALILGYSTESATQTANTVKDKGIPTIALAPGNGITQPYVFKLGPNALDCATLLVGYAKTLNVKSVALLSSNDKAGDDQSQILHDTAISAGLTVSGQVRFSSTESEKGLAPQVTGILETAPDALVVSGLPAQAWTVVKVAQEQNYKGKIFFNATAAGDLFSGTGGTGAAPPVYLAATQTLVSDDLIAITPADAARQQWFNDYIAKYGDFSGYSSYAADAIQVIVDAVRTSGGTDHARLRDAMENTQFDGLTGLIRLTPENHSGVTPTSLTILQAGADRWNLPAVTLH
jgi:branched-chain amino acid transport system substrate-binding protein